MARTKTVKAVTYTDTTVAVIGSVEYETLQLAVDNVADNETVQLVKSVSESVTIPVSKTFTLDLGSNTLTNVDGNHTITNNGTVTITGSGTVDNITHEKAALWNNGTATLTGNTYTRSQENGQGDTDSGGNSYYTIVNHETMTINEGTTVTQNGKFSSMVENGWYDGTQNESKAESVLIINGGNFTGGLNSIKNDDYGKLTINNGTFNNVAQAAVLNWNDTTITNGTFNVDDSADCVVMNGYLSTDNDSDKGVLNIQGGTFSVGSTNSTDVVSLFSSTQHCGDINISGGTLKGNVNMNFGSKKGGSFTLSDSAIVEGQVKNAKFDVVNIDGGTINNGVINNGPGTINITDGVVNGGVNNASNGFTYISGGTIDGGVTQTLPNAVTEITGGTFSNVGESDITQFMPDDTKVETDEQGNIVVSEKVNPTIEISNLPTELTVGQTVDFKVHITPNDYAGTYCLVNISYSGDLSRENGGLSLQYEDQTGWHDLLTDSFGPPDTGFPLNDELTSNFKVTANQTGSTNFTLTVVKFDDKEELCTVTQSVTATEAPVVTKYTVRVTGGTGSGEYEEGASVTCVATIPEGKKFDVWEVTGITGVVLGNSTLTFSMPANDVTCTAKFKDAEQPEPEPTPTPENGWYYIVEETGITIYGLARRFNIPVNKLMSDNNITEMRPLYVGEKILIIDDTEKTVPQTDCWIG